MVTPMTVDACPFLNPTQTQTWLPLRRVPSSTHPEKPILLLAQGSTLALKLSAGAPLGVAPSEGVWLSVALAPGVAPAAVALEVGEALGTCCERGVGAFM